jgi:hypothetical protein
MHGRSQTLSQIPPENQQPQQTPYPQQQPYPPQYAPVPPKRNNCLIYGIIGAVVVLLLCGVVALATGVIGGKVAGSIQTLATQVAKFTPIAGSTPAATAQTVAANTPVPSATKSTSLSAPTDTVALSGVPSATGGTITLAEIKSQRQALTEAQWPDYEKTIIGKTMSGTGVVLDVALSFPDKKPQIAVDVDKDTEIIENRDYLVTIPAEGDDLINKTEEVTFSGSLASLDCFDVYCTPTLDEATYQITGNKQPAKTYPKQSEVHYADFAKMRKQYTEAQWPHYTDSVIGAKISETGYVYDVPKVFLDNTKYDVQISTKKLTGTLDSYQMLFSVPAAEAAKFSKNQAVDFTGQVKQFEICIDVYCTVSIENATYTIK